MAISTVRRLAADILGVGENRIRLSPENLKDIEGAMTRSDVKGLIDKGFVKKLPVQGRASTSKRSRTTAGHRRGHRVSQKTAWMEKVRAQRKFLVSLLSEGAVKADDKWSLYRKVKSGIFRNKKAMLLYLKDNGFVAKTYEVPAKKVPEKVTARINAVAASKAKQPQSPKSASDVKQNSKSATATTASKPVSASAQDTKKKPVSAPSANIKKGDHK